MAATVAHEIAQPLLALSMAAGASRRLLSQQTPDIVTALDAIDMVVAQAERMRNLMVGIRRFSAGGPSSKPKCEPVDAVDAAAEALKLLQPLMERSNVRCSLSAEVPPEDRIVYLHPVQLSQVAVNLLSNAVEAIRTFKAEGEILIRVTRSGDEVVIEVEDDGPGLSAEDAERIFDPNFSSKDSGMGSASPSAVRSSKRPAATSRLRTAQQAAPCSGRASLPDNWRRIILDHHERPNFCPCAMWADLMDTRRCMIRRHSGRGPGSRWLKQSTETAASALADRFRSAGDPGYAAVRWSEST